MSTFPDQLFQLGGVPVGQDDLFTTGKVFFVSSVTGSDNNTQGSLTYPKATIDAAVGLCTADKGDVIVVLPGHTETVIAAAGLDLDVAGIKIIGLGSGSLRPTINFTTDVDADMDVDAANITMKNFLFTGGIDALTGPIDINAADFKLLGCETRDVTGQATDFIVTDANADRLLIDGWIHRGAAGAGADTAITIVGGDDIIIRNFNIYGNFAVAGIENVTTAAVRINIGGGGAWNYIWTANAADIAITMVSTATGFIGPKINCMLTDNAANITEAVTAAACQIMQPINICNLAGETSMFTNITASTDA